MAATLGACIPRASADLFAQATYSFAVTERLIPRQSFEMTLEVGGAVEALTDTSSALTAHPEGVTPQSRSQRLAIPLAIGLAAFGIYLWQLSVPEFLAFYDSGVYLAASMHLVSGILPYRDFTFVNPPGILLLMSPVAVFSRIFGSHDGFILARIVTSLVTALNASLLALLVRHRGRIAMVIAGVGLALLPVAFFVSSALKLDPFCVFFVLLGSNVVFSLDRNGDQPSTFRYTIAGVLFGLAALVKLWAFFPFLAAVICLMPRSRKRALAFVSGAGGGMIVPSLPFLVLAPRQFISQVFTAQLVEKINPTMSPGIMARLIDLTGFSLTSIAPTATETAIAFIVLLFVVGLAFSRRAHHDVIDAYLLLAAVVTVLGLLVAPAYQTYYGYFAAPFLVGLFAVSIARLGKRVRKLVQRLDLRRSTLRFVSWSLGTGGALLIIGLGLYVTTFYTNYAWFWGLNGPYLAGVSDVIPAGSCVVYDYVIYGVYANRLESRDPNCPDVVDPYGMWQNWGDHVVAPAPTFVNEWKTYFKEAQYVVLNAPHTTYIPWNRELTTWFSTHYHSVYAKGYVFIYRNDSDK